MIFDDDIDWSSPLAEHPLNRDALLWWLPAPSRWGGSTTYDLCQKYNGTLVLGAACTGGRGKSPGAWQLDADARIDSPATLPDPATTFTATGWFRHDSTPGTTIYCECGGRWRIQRSGGNLTLTVPGVADNQFASLPISVAGRWYFFAVSLTGTSATGYLDGASQAITLGTPPSSGGNLFCLGDRAFSALGIPGQMTDARLYTRVLGPGEIAFLREQGATGHPALLRRLRRKWFVPEAAPATYTATAALTLGNAELAASGTFATPTYTGTAALTAGNAELAADGYTLGPIPGNSGTADLLLGNAELAASGTFTAPVYTASAALTAGHATLAASGTVTAPVYTGTAALAAGHAALSASGTVTNPTYTATAALTAGHAMLAATGVFASAVFQGTATLTLGHATLAASGTFTVPTYTAAATLTAGHATLAGAASFAVSTFAATVTLQAGHATLLAAATSAVPTFTATATLVAPGAILEAAESVALRVKIRVRGRSDTRMPLRGRVDTTIHLRGNQDMAVRQDVEWARGEDVTLEVTLHPVPTDITGWNLQWKASDQDGGLAVLTKSGVVSDATGGIFTVTIPRADTLTRLPGTYYWEVRRTDAGLNARLAHGRWDLLLERAA